MPAIPNSLLSGKALRGSWCGNPIHIELPLQTSQLVVVHSALQQSIFQCLREQGWESLGVRGEAGTLCSHFTWGLSEPKFVLELVRAIHRRGSNLEVVLPHSDYPNLLFAVVRASKYVSRISYIEDGWKTWLFLTNNPSAENVVKGFWESFRGRCLVLAADAVSKLVIVTLWMPFPALVLLRLLSFLMKSRPYGEFDQTRKFGNFFLSFRSSGSVFVDISPRIMRLEPERKEPLLFLNPRYLNDLEGFTEKLLKSLAQPSLAVHPHPRFLRANNLNLLERFCNLFRQSRVDLEVIKFNNPQQDVVFQAYARGYREFLVADSTIQVTAHNYRYLLPGLRIKSVVKFTDKPESVLEGPLGYLASQVRY